MKNRLRILSAAVVPVSAALALIVFSGCRHKDKVVHTLPMFTSIPEVTSVPADTFLPDETEHPFITIVPGPTYQPSYEATEPAGEDTPSPTDELTAEPTAVLSAAPTPAPTPAPTAAPTPAPTAVQYTAVPTWNGQGYPPIYSQSGSLHVYGDTGVFRVDNSGYESCGYVDSLASSYAGVVNKVAQQLYGRSQVYSLIIPTSYGVTMPDDIRPKVQYYIDQSSCIETAFTHFSSAVRPVRCWDSLMRHRYEYIYFRTDHHWTGRGAYYAYECFCAAKGVTPYSLSQRQEVSFSGFLGTFYNLSGNDSALLPADTVYAYKPVSSSATMYFYENDGTRIDWPIIQDVSGWLASSKYSTFAGGDHGMSVFTNPSVSSGALIVIKDSFGNALLPLLVDHYNKIYEIDYRYWTGSLKQFAIENGVTDVLFALNFHNISNRSTIAKLSALSGE